MLFCSAFDVLVGEFREYELERILTVVADSEGQLFRSVTDSDGACVDDGGLDSELGGIGGDTLHEDTEFIAVHSLEGDIAVVRAGALGSVGKLDHGCGTCRKT